MQTTFVEFFEDINVPAKADPTPNTYWPFGQLTQHQRAQRAAQEQAARRGELRPLPSVFGELA